jgi:hypothetical protein
VSDVETLIPPPATIRERLARNLEERELLKGLYKLSCRAAEGRTRRGTVPSPPEARDTGSAEKTGLGGVKTAEPCVDRGGALASRRRLDEHPEQEGTVRGNYGIR